MKTWTTLFASRLVTLSLLALTATNVGCRAIRITSTEVAPVSGGGTSTTTTTTTTVAAVATPTPTPIPTPTPLPAPRCEIRLTPSIAVAPGTIVQATIIPTNAATLTFEVKDQLATVSTLPANRPSLVYMDPVTTTTYRAKVTTTDGQSSFCDATVTTTTTGICYGACAPFILAPTLPVLSGEVGPDLTFQNPSMRITATRVCSVSRWDNGTGINQEIFFQEAVDPILVVEARGVLTQPLLAVPVSFMKQRLLHTQIGLNFTVPLQRLQAARPFDWANVDLHFAFCDNIPLASGKTYKCSDKNAAKSLSLGEGPAATAQLKYSVTRKAGALAGIHFNMRAKSGENLLASTRKLTPLSPMKPCDEQWSPLVLNFGTGRIRTVSAQDSQVDFFKDAQGERIHTGWLADPRAAFLVNDANNDGQIEAHELFGTDTVLNQAHGADANHVALVPGDKAPNGFVPLRELDTNRDGKISSADQDWSRLQLWFDRNANGISDPTELVSLGAKGVRSISTAYEAINSTDENGNTALQRGRFIHYDAAQGRDVTKQILDLYFAN